MNSRVGGRIEPAQGILVFTDRPGLPGRLVPDRGHPLQQRKLLVVADVIAEVAADLGLVLAAALLGDHVHDARHGLPVLGVERPADHLQFLDGVVLDRDAGAAVEHVGDADAVDPVGHLARPSAPDVDIAAVRTTPA